MLPLAWLLETFFYANGEPGFTPRAGRLKTNSPWLVEEGLFPTGPHQTLLELMGFITPNF